MHSLQNNIELNNNELEQLTGNIENLKVRSDKPDLKLSELENILSEHLKIQNIKDKELKDIRISITNFSNEISELESKKIEIQGQIDSIKKVMFLMMKREFKKLLVK